MNYIRKCGNVCKKIRKKICNSEKGKQERNAMGFYWTPDNDTNLTM